MKKLYSGLLIVVLICSCIFGACDKVSKRKADKTITQNKIDKKHDLKDSERIIGIWFNEKKSKWFEFKQDSLFDTGKKDSLKNENRKWSINEETDRITMYFNKGVKHFDYRFKGDYLIFHQAGRKREMKFIRISTRPDSK